MPSGVGRRGLRDLRRRRYNQAIGHTGRPRRSRSGRSTSPRCCSSRSGTRWRLTEVSLAPTTKVLPRLRRGPTTPPESQGPASPAACCGLSELIIRRRTRGPVAAVADAVDSIQAEAERRGPDARADAVTGASWLIGPRTGKPIGFAGQAGGVVAVAPRGHPPPAADHVPTTASPSRNRSGSPG